MKERKKFVVTSFSYPLEMDPIVHELSVIAARERKSSSEIIIQLIDNFVKAHSEGNNSFKLDNWQKDQSFQAVPTILSDPQNWFKYLLDCTPEERTKILKHANIIRSNAINIGNLRKK